MKKTKHNCRIELITLIMLCISVAAFGILSSSALWNPSLCDAVTPFTPFGLVFIGVVMMTSSLLSGTAGFAFSRGSSWANRDDNPKKYWIYIFTWVVYIVLFGSLGIITLMRR